MSEQTQHITPDEEILVKQLISGNQEALEKIFFTYAQVLINFSVRFVIDRDTAENIVQDVFTKIWMNRKKLNPAQGIKNYLYQAVRNESYKILRNIKIHNLHEERVTELYNKESSIELNYETKELQEIVYKSIEELPIKCREIFKLNRYDGLKYKEIAEILEISPKTVENQMGIALKKIREKLKNLIIILLVLVSSILGVKTF